VIRVGNQNHGWQSWKSEEKGLSSETFPQKVPSAETLRDVDEKLRKTKQRLDDDRPKKRTQFRHLDGVILL
jgi:hypothetical protein